MIHMLLDGCQVYKYKYLTEIEATAVCCSDLSLLLCSFTNALKQRCKSAEVILTPPLKICLFLCVFYFMSVYQHAYSSPRVQKRALNSLELKF